MKTTIVVAAIIALCSTSAMATNPGNNGGGNGGCGVGQQTNGCGGTGGGAGGTGIGIAAQQQGQIQGQQQGQYQSSRNTNSNRSTANGGAGGNGTANANARGGDQSQGQEVNNQGAGSNSNNYNAPAIPVSSATAPSFAIGNCQWAVSGGFQVFGAGVSGGGAGMYEFCKSLMKSKHFREVGNNEVARSLECQDSSIRAAYKEAGQPCPADAPRQVAAVAAPPVPVPVNVVSRRSQFPAGEAGTVQCLNTYGVKACQ